METKQKRPLNSRIKRYKYWVASFQLVFTLSTIPVQANELEDSKKNELPECTNQTKLGKVCKTAHEILYIVDVDENLSFIASKLYGTVDYLPKLLEWNKGIPRDVIKVATKLKLLEFPLYLTEEDQSYHLIKQFRIRFNLSREWLKTALDRLNELKKLKIERTKTGGTNKFAIAIARKQVSKNQSANSEAESSINFDQSELRNLSRAEQAVLLALPYFDSNRLSELGVSQFEKNNLKLSLLLHSSARQKNESNFQSWLQELIILSRCGTRYELNQTKAQLNQSNLPQASKSRIQSILKNLKTESCDASNMPLLKALETDILLEFAESLKQENRCEQSIVLTRMVRQSHPDQIKPWILEISCLKKMEKNTLVISLRKDFLKIHPEMSALPFLRVH